MAYTEFGTNSPQTRKVWADDLMHETLGKMDMKALIGRGEDACIQMKGELSKGAGDTIKCDLLAQDRSNGVNGDSDLEGFETPLTFFQDELKINQKRHAHSFMRMSQQRTVHNLRTAGRQSLSTWLAWFLEASMLAHLAGVAGDGNETVAGALGADTGSADFAGNTITALDSAHFVTAASVGDLTMIDNAVAKAKVNNPRVAPIMVGGQKKYVAYLHPYQVKAIRTTAGATGWNEIQQNAAARGPSNPIYTGALGEYNGVILRESEFVPSVGNVRHAVLLGAGAGLIGVGSAWDAPERKGKGETYFDWYESSRDYGNKKGVAAAAVIGFKRSIFNSATFGVIGMRSTDAAPA